MPDMSYPADVSSTVGTVPFAEHPLLIGFEILLYIADIIEFSDLFLAALVCQPLLYLF